MCEPERHGRWPLNPFECHLGLALGSDTIPALGTSYALIPCCFMLLYMKLLHRSQLIATHSVQAATPVS